MRGTTERNRRHLDQQPKLESRAVCDLASRSRRVFTKRAIIEGVATGYLDRLLDPLTEVFTPEVARAVLGFRPDSELEARVAELRSKANQGTLTPAEDAEYKEFVEAVDLVSIIQAKARLFLAKHPA